ncbi:acyltransferase [Novosphingobium sp. 18052]|nr:acyltransferase [Novosphingobium sp. 18052]
MHERSKRLVLLDGMRGIAAIGVVLFHAELAGPGVIFSRGYLFVDLFFLLSGFVLTLAFDARFGPELRVGTFLRQRLRRFLPLVATGSLLGVLAVHGQDYKPIAFLLSFVVSATLIPLPMTMMFPLNPPQWSLMVELVANGVHARWLHRIPARILLLFAGACAAGMAAMMIRAGEGNLGAGIWQLPTGLLRAGWSYTLGIVFARIWRVRSTRIPADWRIALLAPLAVTTALPFLPAPVWAGDLMVILAIFPALFWMAAGAVIPPPSAERLLTALGAISFPLYAVHFPILRIADELGNETGRAFGVAAAIAVSAALAFAGPQLAAFRKRRLANSAGGAVADA